MYPIDYPHTMGQKHRLHLNQGSLAYLSRNSLQRTNTSHHLLGHQGCLHSHHHLDRRIVLDCMGNSLPALLVLLTQLHSNLVRGYLQRCPYQYLEIVSNFQGIYLPRLHHQPNRLGHHLNNPIVPTMKCRRRLHSRH